MRKPAVIKKEMLISEVVKNYPETTPLFLDYGLHCVGCSFAKDETIEEAAKVHQLNLEKFLKDLNKIIEK
jgi:hybrid cluster-associated redox disulfide protein